MNLAVYVFLALIAGATWGTSLGFLLNAPRKQASEMRQWLALGASMLVVISCAVVMKNAGDLGSLSTASKASAALAFAVAFAVAFIRSRVRL